MCLIEQAQQEELFIFLLFYFSILNDGCFLFHFISEKKIFFLKKFFQCRTLYFHPSTGNP